MTAFPMGHMNVITSWGHRRAVVLALALGGAATAMAANQPGLGQPVSEADLAVWDMSIGPDSKGLPPGGGTPTQGAAIYAQKCEAEQAFRSRDSDGLLSHIKASIAWKHLDWRRGWGSSPRSPKGRAAARGLDARLRIQHPFMRAEDKPIKKSD